MGRRDRDGTSARCLRGTVADPTVAAFSEASRLSLPTREHGRGTGAGSHHDLGKPQLQTTETMTDHSPPPPDTFADLVAISGDEVVSHSFVRDIPLRDDRVLALVTLDNGRDHTRPNTLGPRTLLEYAA